MTDLAGEVAAVALVLGEKHVEELAGAYRQADSYTEGAAAKVRQSLPATHRAEADRINRAWSADPETVGASIALGLEATQVAMDQSGAPKVQVVVTGPDTPHAPVRLTAEVVRQLIEGASSRVTLVSFAAYQMPDLVKTLDAAVARGVKVALILESPENLAGGGGADAYAKYEVFHWPMNHREPPTAKLHAKAIIVDSRDVLLTSANMTKAAYHANIELGVLCQGGGVAERVQQHFDGLIAAGVLEIAAAGTHGEFDLMALDVRTLIEQVVGPGTPRPVVGYETDDGLVVEAAFPHCQLGVLNPGDEVPDGWDARPAGEWTVDELRALLGDGH